MPTYQRLGYNSLIWHTGFPVQHGLPNPIVVWTIERSDRLSSVIAKPSYMFFHWSRPHVGLAFHAIMRGWVSCTQFQQNSLVMSLVDSNMPYLGTIWLAGALACLDSLARTRLSLSWHSCLLFSLAEKETIGTDIIMNKRQDRFPGLPGQSPHCSFIIKFSSLLRCWPENINIYHVNMEACWWRGL